MARSVNSSEKNETEEVYSGNETETSVYDEQNIQQFEEEEESLLINTKSAESHRFVFESTHDLYLLRQASVEYPFIAEYGDQKQKWMKVSDVLNKSFKMRTTWKSCRDRFEILNKRHKADELKSSRSSGVCESYDEKTQLLTEFSALMQENNLSKQDKKEKTKFNKKQKVEEFKKETIATLDSAMEILGAKKEQAITKAATPTKARSSVKMQEEAFIFTLNEQTKLQREELEFKKKVYEDELEEKKKQMNTQNELMAAFVKQMEAQREKDALFTSVIQKFLFK